MIAETRIEALESELEKTLREKVFIEQGLLRIIERLTAELPNQKLLVKEAVSKIYENAAALP